MPLTNAFSAVLISAALYTNYIERADGVRGPVWFRTNIVSLRTVTAVVGPGIPAQFFTNTTVLHTNTTRLRITEEALPPVPKK